MREIIRPSQARELASTGVISGAVFLKRSDGYIALINSDGTLLALATKQGVPRLFREIQHADRLLRYVGVTRSHVIDGAGPSVDTQAHSVDGRFSRYTNLDPSYLSFLEERAEAGRRNPGRRSNEEVNEYMEALCKEHNA